MVSRLTVTETDGLTVSVEPVASASRIDTFGEPPLIVRFLVTMYVPTQVPFTSRVSPGVAASIAPCSEPYVAKVVELSTSQDAGAALAVDPIPSIAAARPGNPSARRPCRTEQRTRREFFIRPPSAALQSRRRYGSGVGGWSPRSASRRARKGRTRRTRRRSRPREERLPHRFGRRGCGRVPR